MLVRRLMVALAVAVLYGATLAGYVPLSAIMPLLAPGTLITFLGISYVTFRSLDVIIGIQDRLIASLPLGQFFAYLVFFPTISSGPIDRWRRFADEWHRPRTRSRGGSTWRGLARRSDNGPRRLEASTTRFGGCAAKVFVKAGPISN